MFLTMYTSVLNISINYCSKILNVEKNIVLEFTSVSSEYDSILLFIFRLICFAYERSVNFNLNIFKSTSDFISTLILYI